MIIKYCLIFPLNLRDIFPVKCRIIPSGMSDNLVDFDYQSLNHLLFSSFSISGNGDRFPPCDEPSSVLQCLICDFCSSARNFAHRELFIPQSGFLQIPSHDGHPCLRLMLPATEYIVDFHHQVNVRAEHNRVGGYPLVE